MTVRKKKHGIEICPELGLHIKDQQGDSPVIFDCERERDAAFPKDAELGFR